MTLRVRPITQRAAFAFIDANHSHHKSPQGFKFAVAVEDGGGRLCGVATSGRPVSRILAGALGGESACEVTRCCTDRTPHVASMLYGACWRIAKAMGYRVMLTYILVEEEGVSLKAAGWHRAYTTKARSGGWKCSARPNASDAHPLGQKVLYWIGDDHAARLLGLIGNEGDKAA